MKAIHIIMSLLLVGSVKPIFSQDSVSIQGLISDIKLYSSTISTQHKNAFTKISKVEFNQKIENLLSTIQFADKDKFTVELFKINSSIEDEHTMLFPAFELELPLKFELFDEGMTIIAADSINQKYLLHKIIAIDKTPWNKIDSLYKTIIKRDNPSYFKFFQTYYFQNPELLKGLGVIDSTKKLQLQLVSPAGDTINTIIYSRNKSKGEQLYYAPQFKSLLACTNNKNYWYIYDEKSSVIYFNYQSCIEDKNESFKVFNDRLFRTIEEVKPGRIVIDLRFNSGGNSGLFGPFMAKIKKSELNKKGRIYVLIGRKVMSSAVMNAIELKRTTNAIFIGEQTGGNVNHFGELKSFILPYSKIRVTYSTKYWENWENHEGSFKPDIETANSLTDFIGANDRALERAIKN